VTRPPCRINAATDVRRCGRPLARVPCLPRRLAAAALAGLVALGCSSSRERADGGQTGAAAGRERPAAVRPAALPPIRHVFLIVLENQAYATTFGAASPAPYLADTMAHAGALLRQYYGIAHSSLPNYIAIISGLAPDPETQHDCVRYTAFVESGTAPGGQPIGRGCIYPAHVPTIANQLAARGFTWKGYMEDMGNDPARESATCGHPPIGALDRTQHAAVGDQYAAKHNPFVYFHAILDSAPCQSNVVALSRLESDLRTDASTPNFAFIVPNLCHDAHDEPCVDGEPGGLVSADRWLAHWVPLITRAPAFRDGLLIVTFDEALDSDASACCNEPTGPNTARPGITGPGGGRIGAVLLSPFIRPGTDTDVPYNHYSLLKSLEDVFGLPYLGYGASALAGFGPDVYTRAVVSSPGRTRR
jgi:hypothetical protein